MINFPANYPYYFKVQRNEYQNGSFTYSVSRFRRDNDALVENYSSVFKSDDDAEAFMKKQIHEWAADTIVNVSYAVYKP